MPIVQERNASMQELNSADAQDIEDRNFGAEWYDSTGGQTFILGNAAIVLNLNTQRVNSAPTIFSMASSILTITEAGLYLFSYSVTLAQNGGSNINANHAYLEQDPATGTFAPITSLRNYFPVAPLASAIGSGMMTSIVQVGINYRYRVRVEQVTGSAPMITVANTSKLSVIRLFKNG